MSLIEAVEKHARKEFSKKVWETFPYHNLTHTEFVVDLCKEMSDALELPPDQVEILLIAAWFHDLGYTNSYPMHEAASQDLAKEYLEKAGYEKHSIRTICELIESTRVDYFNHKTLLEQIMFDADRGSVGQPDFFALGDKLRDEWDMHDFALFSDEGWNALQVRYLENTQFKTSYSIKKYGKQRLSNLRQAKAELV